MLGENDFDVDIVYVDFDELFHAKDLDLHYERGNLILSQSNYQVSSVNCNFNCSKATG
jgi:hypothetical protein